MGNFLKETKQLSEFFDSINKQSGMLTQDVGLKDLQTEANRSADIFKGLWTEAYQVDRSAGVLKDLQAEANRNADIFKGLWTEAYQVDRSAGVLKDLQAEANRNADIFKGLWTEAYQVDRSAGVLKDLQTEVRHLYQDVGVMESARERSGLVNEFLPPVHEQTPTPDDESKFSQPIPIQDDEPEITVRVSRPIVIRISSDDFDR